MENRLYAGSRRLRRSARQDGAPRALLIASFEQNGIGTVVDYLNAIVGHSSYRVDVLNLRYCPIQSGAFELPVELELDRYRAVILHSTACYNPDHLFLLDARRGLALRKYNGVKAMLKQDEHFRTGRLLDYLDVARFDVLATCLNAVEARKVYLPDRYPDLTLLPVLTGYVTPEMRALSYPPAEERPIDVGYRGSPQAWNFGRLAYEKFQIGERFSAEARRFGLNVDVSSRWEDRFFGRAWLDFLGRCKATLGVESGANVIDYTGEVESACNRYLKQHPKATFEEVYDAVLEPHHDKIDYRAVSPRHFEAAACRTVQILYEGEYRGIFQPWRHYLPLRRDFTNLPDIVQALRDGGLCRQITDCAFSEIVENPAYSYEGFVRELDRAILARESLKSG